jgi:hypothetical protein
MSENKKMKIAVCYSGMFRNFTETVENHIKHLYSKYDCDVYFSFWDVYGDGGFNSHYIKEKLVILKPVNLLKRKFLMIKSYNKILI